MTVGRKGTNEDGTRGERFAGVFPADVAAWLRKQSNISATIVRLVTERMKHEKAMASTLSAGAGNLPVGKDADNGGQEDGPSDCR